MPEIQLFKKQIDGHEAVGYHTKCTALIAEHPAASSCIASISFKELASHVKRTGLDCSEIDFQEAPVFYPWLRGAVYDEKAQIIE